MISAWIYVPVYGFYCLCFPHFSVMLMILRKCQGFFSLLIWVLIFIVSATLRPTQSFTTLLVNMLTPSPLVRSWGARSAEEDVTVVTTQDNSGADLNQLGDIKPSDPMWMIWNKRNLWSMLLVINLVKWVFPLPVVSLSIVMPGLAVFVLLDKQSETQDSDQASRGCQHRSDHS